MEIIFLVFGIISLLLLSDGYSLKKGRSKGILTRMLTTSKATEKVSLIGQFMMAAGILSLIWTIISYVLYDLLVLGVFLLVYFGIIAVVGLLLFAAYKKRFG